MLLSLADYIGQMKSFGSVILINWHLVCRSELTGIIIASHEEDVLSDPFNLKPNCVNGSVTLSHCTSPVSLALIAYAKRATIYGRIRLDHYTSVSAYFTQNYPVLAEATPKQKGKKSPHGP